MDKQEIIWHEESGEITVYEFVKNLVSLDVGETDYNKARGLLLKIRIEGNEKEAIILIGDTNLEGGICDDCHDECRVVGWSDTLVSLINDL
jgi:hypothetical protein